VCFPYLWKRARCSVSVVSRLWLGLSSKRVGLSCSRIEFGNHRQESRIDRQWVLEGTQGKWDSQAGELISQAIEHGMISRRLGFLGRRFAAMNNECAKLQRRSLRWELIQAAFQNVRVLDTSRCWSSLALVL